MDNVEIIRPLTQWEHDVLFAALQYYVNSGHGKPTRMRKSASDMIDQGMYKRFFWSAEAPCPTK